MSSVFDGYERQYCELSAHLSRTLADLPGLSPDEYKVKLKEVEAGIGEAEGLTKRMDLEARSLPPAYKASLLAKIRELKSDLNQLKKDFKACPPTPPPPGGAHGDAHSRITGDRSELLQGMDSSSRGGMGMGSEHGRSGGAGGGAKMMSEMQRVEQSSERLEQSRRMLVETEDLGVSILEDLHQQRQTLLHARDSLYGVDDSIARARQVLNNMAKNINRNRWVAGGAACILLAAIVLVISMKLRNHG